MVNVPGIKIGSGNAYVQDLMFVGESTIDIEVQDLKEEVEEHIDNGGIHTTNEERNF